MKAFRNMSIKLKLVIVIICTSIITLFTAFTAYLGIDIYREFNEMKKNAVLQASLIGQYAAAPLLFGYKEEAAEVLNKLNAIPSIKDACLYSPNSGEVFVSYHKTPDSSFVFPALHSDNAAFCNGHFHIFYSIKYNSNYCGSLYLRIDPEDIYNKIEKSVLLMFVLLLALIIAVYFISFRLQRIISLPILKLAEQTAIISQNHDFSVHLTPYGNDEIGILYNQFNNLLLQILIKQKERDKVLEDLQESETHFRFLFEQNPAIMLIYDLSSLKLVSVNEAFIHHYGYQQEEILNMKLTDLYPENEKGAIIELIKTLKGLAYTGEWHHVKKDGTIINIETHSHSYIAENNAVRIAVINDITARKKVEEEILTLNAELENRVKERTAQLEASNKELEAFSYSVSHDLRAPLRHVNGYLELLSKRGVQQLDEKSKHYMQSILEAATQMGILIDDLLNFSRAGRMELKLDKVDMNRPIKDALNILEQDTKNRKIEWKIAQMPEVMADYAIMRQVWTNLIGNAVKYSRKRELALIEVGYTEDTQEYIFYVRDNGAGFNMNYAQKLFGVFQRLHSTEDFEGTGIGLANVRQFIKKHNGRTWAEGEIDKGATFYFSLPKI